MNDNTELAVTLTPALFAHLTAEAFRLDVPLEWLVAALVLDTVGDEMQPACLC
ncbi:MAG: hypothetical protein P4L84_14110 [Isosphaeraceae bacterium]|nr:hypothetical protein [Isosphaeraceae bacterium]